MVHIDAGSRGIYTNSIGGGGGGGGTLTPAMAHGSTWGSPSITLLAVTAL